MQKIIIIGTLHAGITPNSELKKVLREYMPDQILVEIQERDIINNNIDNYPPEMIFALRWARINSVKVSGFDSDINVFNEGITNADNLALIEQQKKLIKMPWKEFNKAENEKILDIEGSSLVNQEKEKEREIDMLNNIKGAMLDSGTILIITGCAHLKFLEKKIEKAIFPFR